VAKRHSIVETLFAYVLRDAEDAMHNINSEAGGVGCAFSKED
jgi:hypothetical protein